MNKPREDALAPGAEITRKDFLNTALLGAGAALLGAAPPAEAIRAAAEAGVPDPWTGPAA